MFLTPSLLFADQTILLRKGGKVIGNVVGQNEKTITVQSESGKQTINKRDILKIIYKDITKEEENRIRKEEEKKVQENPQVVEEPVQVIETPPTSSTISGPSRNRWSAVWRSAILPGWGQWYTDNKLEAKITGGAFLGSLALAGYARSEAESAKSKYDDAVSKSSTTGSYIYGGGIANFYLLTVVPGARADYESSVQAYNTSVYVLGGVYLAQLVRTYFLGKSWEQGSSVNPVAWTVVPKPDWSAGRMGWGAEASFSLGF
ncbi:LA_0442/LA_0875 N-terminal domain-containing protein [Leptospira hartskeerlii]